MTWPTTPAGTANIDAGSDKPALARPDIKQNIDNVNAIINTFDIASPSNGDILTYNSSSGAWEPGAAASTGTNVALFNRDTAAPNEQLVSGSTTRLRFTLTDPNSFITVVDNYQSTFAAGTYLFDCFANESDTQTDLTLWNETTSASLANFNYNEMGSTGEGFRFGKTIKTLTGTTNISFRATNTDVNQRNGTGFNITVIKL